MPRTLIDRRLAAVSKQLRSLRADLQVTREQLLQLADEADDARLRALVSETPAAQRQHREAARHAERLRYHRVRLLEQIAVLDAEMDDLLDRFSATP